MLSFADIIKWGLATKKYVQDLIAALDTKDEVLLGTLTTTSGTIHTLSGLNLTPYKRVRVEYIAVSHSGASSSQFWVNEKQATAQTVSNTQSLGGESVFTRATKYGISYLSNMSGAGNAFSTIGYAPHDVVNTTTTSLAFRWASGYSFDGGTIKVYGIK